MITCNCNNITFALFHLQLILIPTFTTHQLQNVSYYEKGNETFLCRWTKN